MIKAASRPCENCEGTGMVTAPVIRGGTFANLPCNRCTGTGRDFAPEYELGDCKDEIRTVRAKLAVKEAELVASEQEVVRLREQRNYYGNLCKTLALQNYSAPNCKKLILDISEALEGMAKACNSLDDGITTLAKLLETDLALSSPNTAGAPRRGRAG